MGAPTLFNSQKWTGDFGRTHQEKEPCMNCNCMHLFVFVKPVEGCERIHHEAVDGGGDNIKSSTHNKEPGPNVYAFRVALDFALVPV